MTDPLPKSLRVPPSLLVRAIGIIVAYAALAATQELVFMTELGLLKPWWESILVAFLPWLTWLLASPVLAWTMIRFRIGAGRTYQRIGVQLLAALLVGTVFHPIAVIAQEHSFRLIAQQTPGPDDDVAEPATAVTWDVSLVPSLGVVIFDVATYLILTTIVSGWLRSVDARARTAQAERLEHELAVTRLHALRTRIRPHFLFNALAGIQTLIETDPAAAQLMLLRLSRLLRRSFQEFEAQEVPLGDELEFVKDYLGIEAVRFGDRLDVRIEVPPPLLEVMVPSLLLQPIVENVIIHGVDVSVRPIRLEIEAARTGEGLRILVRDDGPGLEADGVAPREGVGLGTTRGRLAGLHGERGRLTSRRPEGGGFEVEILLPIDGLTEPGHD